MSPGAPIAVVDVADAARRGGGGGAVAIVPVSSSQSTAAAAAAAAAAAGAGGAGAAGAGVQRDAGEFITDDDDYADDAMLSMCTDDDGDRLMTCAFNDTRINTAD